MYTKDYAQGSCVSVYQRNGVEKRRRQLKRRILCGILALCLISVLISDKGLLLKTRLTLSGCPYSIKEFVEKYPEAMPFAENYKRYHTSEGEIDLSGEVEQGKIPLLIQWDKRWAYRSYGNQFLGVTGCGPTCLSMVVCGLTGNTQWDPSRMAEWAEQQGYYVPGAGSAWSLMTEGAALFSLTEKTLALDNETILAELREGHPIICSMGPGDFTTGGHFIVLSGLYEDGSVRVNDPNSPKNSKKQWEINHLVGQMKGAWAYQMW